MTSSRMAGFVFVVITMCSGCQLFSPRPALDRMPWTEGHASQSMLVRVRGTILDGNPWEGDALHSFPSGTSRDIDLPSGRVAVSGPDADGCIATLRTNGTFVRDRLQLIRANGKEETLFVRSNIAPSPVVALAEHGQRIAVASSFDRGGFDYSKRAVEIFDVPTGKTRVLDLGDVRSLVWVLDGHALAYAVNGHVKIYDYDSKETRELCEGMQLASANTQDRLLVTWGSTVHSVDVASGNSIEHWDLSFLPGQLLGQTPEGLFIVEAWATREEGVEFPSFTMTAPGHTWTVKAFDPASREFCTLISRAYKSDRDYRLPRVPAE